MTDTCATCRWSLLYGTRGHCLRPGAGYVRPRKITDPFLPATSASEYCGSHVTLHQIRLDANPRNPTAIGAWWQKSAK